MAKRARKRGAGTQWAVAGLVVAALLLVWWLSARRAEAPGLPANIPGARALSEPPAEHDGPHDEITDDEKQGLEKVLREHAAPAPAK